MAIVFVSIRKRQQMFFWAISLCVLAVLLAISFVVLSPEINNPSDIVVQEVFSAPDITINFNLIDSGQVKNLEPFTLPNPQITTAVGRENPFLPSTIK